MNQKKNRLCRKIQYFGISVPFCYYSLLGRVIDFPSRVRVVKKIASTGRVASTRHSLIQQYDDDDDVKYHEMLMLMMDL